MLLFLLFPLLLTVLQACDSRNGQVCIQVYNKCPFAIWPGVQGKTAALTPSPSGFRLNPGETKDIKVPDGWESGRIWARRDCDGKMNCATGSCGNSIECEGRGGEPPASLAEFTLNGHAGQDYYDVSMVDGYNLPVFIEPVEGTYNTNGGGYDCKRAGGCTKDLNDPALCPSELRKMVNGKIAGCKSACLAFNTDFYCCRGAHKTAETCRSSDWPKNYPAIFKSACPKAYSYAYDDTTSTFTCRGKGTKSPVYRIQFC